MRRSSVLILIAAVVAALQIGFLAWTISTRAAVLRDGREVLLKVQPVDPRDLLRGDYVVLGYEASNLPKEAFVKSPDVKAPVDNVVWVLLRKGADGVYAPAAYSFDRGAMPQPGADEVIVRAKSVYSDPDQGARVDYGIERFYLPEGEGKQIEKDMRERPFFVVAAIAEDGTAQIKAFKDGQTTLFEEPYY